MSIWKKKFTLEEMQRSRRHTMLDFLGIEFVEIGDDFLIATMPVNERTMQPYGIMHGGASCTLAESIASVAANFCVDQDKQYCVGMEINTSHIRPVSSGTVRGIALPTHLGKTTQLWEINILDEHDRIISVNRLRLAVLDKEKPKQV